MQSLLKKMFIVRSSALVDINFALIVCVNHTLLVPASFGSFGIRNVRTSLKPKIGLQLIPSRAPSVGKTCTKMVAATWCLVSCVCGQYFCWLCGGATGSGHTLTNIDGHTCGRYKEDEEEDIEKAQRDLKRYTHYYSRWKAHNDSLKLEEKQKELLEEKILDLKSKKSYRWLTKSLQRLFRARRVLSYSYPFAFHMFGDDILDGIWTTTERELKQNLFEDRQQLLEGTVERLSQIIEGPLDEQSLRANRSQVIELTILADTYCGKMYEYIQDDLVDNLDLTKHHIAPYNSEGVHTLSDR
jgi:ariadne-1